MKYQIIKLRFALVPLAGLLLGASTLASPPAKATEITVHLTPTCRCCTKWVTHLEQNGFEATVHKHDDVTPIKSRLGVPQSLHSCHTAEVDGYVIEGHVPVEDIQRLLRERPDGVGIAVPGMPIGSPGMEQGNRQDPYSVILFGKGVQKVFATH